MATVYGFKGPDNKGGSNNFYFSSFATYTVVTNNNTTYSLKLKGGIYLTNHNGPVGIDGITTAMSGTGQTSKSTTDNFRHTANTASYSAYYNGATTTFDPVQITIPEFTWTWSKGHSAASKTISIAISKSGYLSESKGTVTITVPKRTSYTISYNKGNTGSDTVNNLPSSQTKWYDEALTLSSTVPTRVGYNFKGWATTSTGSVKYAKGGTYPASSNSNATLYAVWEEKTYTLSYNKNTTDTVSNMPSSQTKYHTQRLILAEKVPTRTGYDFVEWNAEPDGSGSSHYKPGPEGYTDVNSTRTLYAQWSLKTYTITYNKNTTDTVSNMPASTTKSYGVAKTLSSNIPTRTNYIFNGWATSSTGSVVYPKNQTNTYSGNNNLNLYAVWQLNYVKPVISSPKAFRVRDESSTSELDNGTFIRVTFSYTAGVLGEDPQTCYYSITIDGADTPIDTDSLEYATGSFSPAENYGPYSENASHTVVIKLWDSNYSAGTTKTIQIATAIYPIDITSDSNGVSMGIMRTAESGEKLVLSSPLVKENGPRYKINSTNFNVWFGANTQDNKYGIYDVNYRTTDPNNPGAYLLYGDGTSAVSQMLLKADDLRENGGKYLSKAPQCIEFQASSGTTKTLNVPNNSTGVIFAMAASEASGAAYLYNCSSTGGISSKAIVTGSNITFGSSSNTITLKGASYSTRYMVITFYGSLPDVT